MSDKTRQTLLASVAVTLLASPAFAQVAGYDETAYSASVGSGARALAMGGAFIAIADDATAAAWNPAGIAVLEKPEASLVWRPSSRFKGTAPAYTYTYNDPGFFRYVETGPSRSYTLSGPAIEFAGFSYPIRAGSWKVVPQFSYHRAVDFGLDYKASAYRIDSTFTFGGFTDRDSFDIPAEESDSSGGLDVYAASVGVSFNPKIFLGASVNWWGNGLEGEFRDEVGFTATRKEDYSGMNFNVGAIFKPTNKLRFGAVYKTGFDVDRDTTETFKPDPNSPEETFSFKSTQEWPSTFGVGVAILPTERLTLSFDFTQTKWSESVIRFEGFEDEPENFFGDDQVDGRQLRFGAEYVLLKPGMGLTALPLRAGFFTDQQPFDKDADYTGITAGFGLVWSRITLDFAFLQETGESPRPASNENLGGGVTESITFNPAFEDVTVRKFYVSTIFRF